MAAQPALITYYVSKWFRRLSYDRREDLAQATAEVLLRYPDVPVERPSHGVTMLRSAILDANRSGCIAGTVRPPLRPNRNLRSHDVFVVDLDEKRDRRRSSALDPFDCLVFKRELQSACVGLGERMWYVVVRYHLDGVKQEDIAKELGLTTGRVSQLLTQAGVLAKRACRAA